MNDCNQPCRELSKLEEKVEGHEDRITKVELATKDNEVNIKDVTVFSSRQEEMIKNLIAKIDNLENRLFSFLSAVTRNQSKEGEDWKDLIKWVIGATIVALIGYVFGKGGV